MIRMVVTVEAAGGRRIDKSMGDTEVCRSEDYDVSMMWRGGTERERDRRVEWSRGSVEDTR